MLGKALGLLTGKETTVKNVLSNLFLVILVFLPIPALAQHVNPCIEAAWSPEVLTFYGNSAQVTEKLAKVQSNLLDRRVYLIVLETKAKTEAALFERKDGANVLLSEWATASKVNLAATLNEKLLKNAGMSCAGELTKAVLRALGDDTDQGRLIPAPATALAAYTQATLLNKQSTDDYIRVTLFLDC